MRGGDRGGVRLPSPLPNKRLARPSFYRPQPFRSAAGFCPGRVILSRRVALPRFARSGPFPDITNPAQRYRAPGLEPARLRRSVFTEACRGPAGARSGAHTARMS